MEHHFINSKKVIVVDDENDIRETVKDILEDNMKEMEQEILAMKERLAQLKDQK